MNTIVIIGSTSLIIATISFFALAMTYSEKVAYVSLNAFLVSVPTFIVCSLGYPYLAEMVLVIGIATSLAVPFAKKCMNAWERHKAMREMRNGSLQIDEYGNAIIVFDIIV